MDTGKFKLGDKVTLHTHSSYCETTQGKEGEIVAVREKNDYVVFFKDCEARNGLHCADVSQRYLMCYSEKHYKKIGSNGDRLELKEHKGLYLGHTNLTLVVKKGNTRLFREV